ncbi:MAG TPA: hypothetical protein VER78_01450 [Thermoanaerobaculia bacterium]|nr:hypothetical protein [Thermoanaerobaculia bacterium]
MASAGKIPVPLAKRPPSGALLLLAGALWLAGLPVPAQNPTPTPLPATVTGTWLMDFNRPDSFLRLTRDSGKPAGIGGTDLSPFRLQDCLGLKRPSGPAKGPVRFRVARDSGVLEFEGWANESAGAGQFRFEPEEAFVEHITEATADQIYAMTLYDVSVEYIRNLQGLGYMPRPSAYQLLALRSRGVDIDYVAELKMLGYERVPVRDLLRMRLSGVTPRFIREQKGRGLERLTVEELIERSLRGQ